MKEVERAESTWGNTYHQYTKDMFNFIISKGASYLDLACGFGRFLRYLTLEKGLEVDYIGYDSSPDMIEKIRTNFPQFTHRTYCRDITLPISHRQECILASAVLIHITLPEQGKVLKAIKDSQPRAIAFDINSPSERWLLKGDHFERIIMSGFRMTWQSHYLFTRKVMSLFPNYLLTTKFYKVHNNANRHKVVYLLERED